MFDVIVIGSGPAGYVAAIKASQLGLKTLCIEESIDSAGKINLGGTCLNVGCIPSKTLLDSSHRYYEANKNLSEHGIKIGKLELDLNSMMKRKDDIVNKLTGGISGLFSANKVQSISGRGKVTSTNTVEVTKSDGSIENKSLVGTSPVSNPGTESLSSHLSNFSLTLARARVSRRDTFQLSVSSPQSPVSPHTCKIL